jgi:hypothetical protein
MYALIAILISTQTQHTYLSGPAVNTTNTTNKGAWPVPSTRLVPDSTTAGKPWLLAPVA